MYSGEKGVALKYTGEIPKIIAIARGNLLEKLLELAKQNNITILKDPDLAEILSKLRRSFASSWSLKKNHTI